MQVKYAGRRGLGVAVAIAAALALNTGTAVAATADDSAQLGITGGSLAFNNVPNVPVLGDLTLNGTAQTATGQMNAWEAKDPTGTGAGWNVSVQGDSAGGKSPVFKEYCLDDQGDCAGDGVGYVSSSPKTLAADSLTLDSSGAGFTAQDGTTGTAPTHGCDAGCSLDHASATPIASAATDAGMGSFRAAAYAGDSVSLAIPTTTKALPSNKVYRVDLVWTLGSGPA